MIQDETWIDEGWMERFITTFQRSHCEEKYICFYAPQLKRKTVLKLEEKYPDINFYKFVTIVKDAACYKKFIVEGGDMGTKRWEEYVSQYRKK